MRNTLPIALTRILEWISIIKRGFQRPTNHDDERHKTADYCNLEKIIGRCEKFVWSADKYCLSFHCTMVTDLSLTD